jgi:hypothetical protein
MSLMVRHGRPDRAIELGRTCEAEDAKPWLAVAHLARGDLEEASDLMVEMEEREELDIRTSLRIHLLAGQLGRAAAEARSEADRLDREVEARPNERFAILGSKLRCVALQLEARGGDEAAKSTLENSFWDTPRERLDSKRWSAHAEAHQMCRFLSIDLTPPSERPIAVSYGPIPQDIARVQDLLSWERTGPMFARSWMYPADDGATPGLLGLVSPLVPEAYGGLEPTVFSKAANWSTEYPENGYAGPTRTGLQARSAAFELYVGNHDRARELTRPAPGDSSTDDHEPPDDDSTESEFECSTLEALGALALLDQDRFDEVEPRLDRITEGCRHNREILETLADMANALPPDSYLAIEHSRPLSAEDIRNMSQQGLAEVQRTELQVGQARALLRFHQGADIEQLEPLYTRDGDSEWSLREGWRAALEGDGTALVRLMDTPAAKRYLPPLAPRVIRDREALLAAIGANEHGLFEQLNSFPGEDHQLIPELERVAQSNAVARALGFDSRAAASHEALDRLREALLRREIALPLAVLEML